ncbi:unnamed protein product [Lathyrus sativus]|nr:unnamed protein product [Lathyrus sativus]
MDIIMLGTWPEPSTRRSHYAFCISLYSISWYVGDFGPGLAFSSECFRYPFDLIRSLLYDLYLDLQIYIRHLSLLESAKCMNWLEHMKLIKDLRYFFCHHNGYVVPTKNLKCIW